MPRKNQGWITFQSSEEERRILDEYCQRSQRTKTEILRELIRDLGHSLEVSESQEELLETPSRETLEIQNVAISARNVLSARVLSVMVAGVNAEVALEIAPNLELTSTITRASAERLQLAPGKEVYAVIKSSNVIIAAVPRAGEVS